MLAAKQVYRRKMEQTVASGNTRQAWKQIKTIAGCNATNVQNSPLRLPSAKPQVLAKLAKTAPGLSLGLAGIGRGQAVTTLTEKLVRMKHE